MNLLGLLYHRTKLLFPRSCQIGRHTIKLPAGHRLDYYRWQSDRYDRPLLEISTLLSRKYSDFCAIDIGANIGDSAAAITHNRDAPVLCIEGSTTFFPLLRQNLRRVSRLSEIEESFIGPEDSVMRARVVTGGGSAGIEAIGAEGSTVSLRSLRSVLNDHPRFRRFHLMKIDTDGFDCRILRSCAAILNEVKPTLYFEYWPFGALNDAEEYNFVFDMLCSCGFHYFHVYDHSGHHMLRMRQNEIKHLKDLSAYARSSVKSVRPSVYYFDVCALTHEDSDISDAIYASATGSQLNHV